VLRWRVWVGLAFLVAGLGAALVLLRQEPFYRASAVVVLLPRERPSLDLNVLHGSIEAKNDGGEKSSPLTLPANPELYTTLLASRPVLERIHSRFSARLVLADADSDEAVRVLRKALLFDSSDEGLITITVTLPDPTLARDVANALVEEGRHASSSIERDMISGHVDHLDQAVHEIQQRVAREKVLLREFHETNRLIDPTREAEDTLQGIREVLAARDKVRAELMARLKYCTEADPTIQRMRARIEAFEARAHELRASIAGSAGTLQFGAMRDEYELLSQSVQQGRNLLDTMRARASILRIRCSQPVGNMAVVRRATAPDRPAGPSKKRTLGVAFAAAIFLGTMLSVAREQWDRSRQHPETQQSILRLCRAIQRPTPLSPSTSPTSSAPTEARPLPPDDTPA
jgi:uncharacterized protein involved in exopolysaccharide biosynthesis